MNDMMVTIAKIGGLERRLEENEQAHGASKLCHLKDLFLKLGSVLHASHSRGFLRRNGQDR